jgi:Domain of Unknown Function with PDB structure (DUF3857)
MQKFFLLIACLFATTNVATAQKKAKKAKELVIEYGKIPEEDLKMTVYAPDSSADAVVLAAKGRLSVEYNFDGFKLHRHVLRRVKLLKKSSFDSEGNISIPYRTDGNFEDIWKLSAAVVQPDGTRQELSKKDFFNEKTTAQITTRKFAFPNLQEGSIIEYEFEMITKERLYQLYDWYFQENIPVRHSELSLSFPSLLTYAFLFKGQENLKLDDNGGTKFYADSLPALRPEAYITTMNDYLTQVTFQLSKITQNSGETEERLSTWDILARELWTNRGMGEHFNVRGNYVDVWRAVKPLLATAQSDDEKIKIVSDFLSKNMNSETLSAFSNASPNEAFKKRKGNSGVVNMMLLACLSEAGVKASPILISTRGNGKPIIIYPIVDQFDHLACYIDRGDKSFIVDVGNEYRPIGMPRIQALNGQGWILDLNKPRWVPIVAPLSTEASLATFKLNEEGTLTGSIVSSFQGYAAVNERTDAAKDDNSHATVKKALTKDFPDIKIENIAITNLNNLAEPFKRTVNCVIPSAATTTGKLIYIKPTLKTGFDENPFKQANRAYPVEFSHPFRNNFSLNLTIPDGFVVEELPKSIRMKLPNNGGTFQYASSVNGNVVQLVMKIQIDQLRFEPDDYALVKAFFGQIATKSAEQIVLKKK